MIWLTWRQFRAQAWVALAALAVLAIFSIMWRWNEFLWPLVVLSRSENFTLQLALNSFQGELTTSWNLLLAMTVLFLVGNWYRRERALPRRVRLTAERPDLSRRRVFWALAILLSLVFSKAFYQASLGT